MCPEKMTNGRRLFCMDRSLTNSKAGRIGSCAVHTPYSRFVELGV
jgi:hypothetical protein